jgi:F0F1-type ATP synthase beta subunit
LLGGAGDDYPEQSFYMVGGLKEAFEKGRKLNEM